MSWLVDLPSSLGAPAPFEEVELLSPPLASSLCNLV
jgi:hypothetical protein